MIQKEKEASYHHRQLGHWVPQMSSTCRGRELDGAEQGFANLIKTGSGVQIS